MRPVPCAASWRRSQAHAGANTKEAAAAGYDPALADRHSLGAWAAYAAVRETQARLSTHCGTATALHVEAAAVADAAERPEHGDLEAAAAVLQGAALRCVEAVGGDNLLLGFDTRSSGPTTPTERAVLNFWTAGAAQLLLLDVESAVVGEEEVEGVRPEEEATRLLVQRRARDPHAVALLLLQGPRGEGASTRCILLVRQATEGGRSGSQLLQGEELTKHAPPPPGRGKDAAAADDAALKVAALVEQLAVFDRASFLAQSAGRAGPGCAGGRGWPGCAALHGAIIQGAIRGAGPGGAVRLDAEPVSSPGAWLQRVHRSSTPQGGGRPTLPTILLEAGAVFLTPASARAVAKRAFALSGEAETPEQAEAAAEAAWCHGGPTTMAHVLAAVLDFIFAGQMDAERVSARYAPAGAFRDQLRGRPRRSTADRAWRKFYKRGPAVTSSSGASSARRFEAAVAPWRTTDSGMEPGMGPEQRELPAPEMKTGHVRDPPEAVEVVLPASPMITSTPLEQCGVLPQAAEEVDPTLTSYELKRAERVAQNRLRLVALGLLADSCPPTPPRRDTSAKKRCAPAVAEGDSIAQRKAPRCTPQPPAQTGPDSDSAAGREAGCRTRSPPAPRPGGETSSRRSGPHWDGYVALQVAAYERHVAARYQELRHVQEKASLTVEARAPHRGPAFDKLRVPPRRVCLRPAS